MKEKIEEINKIVNPVSRKIGKKYANVFIKIEYKGKKLSISGVEGPHISGNCRGSCGQIDMDYKTLAGMGLKYKKGWSLNRFKNFLNVWDQWHLNDMKAGCIHQRILLKDIKNHNYENLIKLPEFKKCSVCGYSYGSSWLFEEVPNDVLVFLDKLPETKITPAWV